MVDRTNPKPIGYLEYGDRKLILSIGSYSVSGNMAVLLHYGNGEPFATVSKNIPSLDIDSDQFFVNWYNLTPQLMQSLNDCGFFEDTGRRIKPAGSHIEIPLWGMKNTITAKYITAYEE